MTAATSTPMASATMRITAVPDFFDDGFIGFKIETIFDRIVDLVENAGTRHARSRFNRLQYSCNCRGACDAEQSC